MSAFQGIGGIAARYLASPQGHQMIRDYLSTPQGQKTVDEYLMTAAGQEMAMLLLSRALEGLDLPPEIKEVIREAMKARSCR